MKYRVFSYPVPCDEEVSELNGFLGSHRVLDVTQFVVPKAGGACLVFVVEYEEGKGKERERRAERVDYRDRLDEAEFGMYCQLRDLRKSLAEAEQVPVYNVFTNAQLAEIVARRAASRASLSAIEGIGESRLEKYGERFLALCRDLFGQADSAQEGQGGPVVAAGTEGR